MKRSSFIPLVGKEYHNQGGGSYKCLEVRIYNGTAVMQNISSKWTFVAHGLGMYHDGSIDWDYSTGGYFDHER